ncbi:MAG: HAMP domain-containing protein [Chitinivibrionales bacterium]|nr:HAMP domain-containing protein [Chitinivibrionales bacterium]
MIRVDKKKPFHALKDGKFFLMIIPSKSLFFKTAIIYAFVTIFNVAIFIIMVFENQLDLIADNAIMNSKLTGSNLKYRIDKILGPAGDITVVNINKILKEANALGIKDLTVFNEEGDVFVDIKDNKPTAKQKADVNDLRMINMAITKRGFEDKLFFHTVHKKTHTIDLYIPFTFGDEKIGIAFITLLMQDIDRQMSYLYRQCAVIAALIILLHIAFAWLFSKMILLPLRKLNEATEKIAGGDLDIRVQIVRDDEIGQLATSFNEMSVALRRMRDEAKGSNPLTGLPGNITIANYLDECLQHNRFICVLYCDLDNFKAYNDKYGFTKGDDAILYTRDCLQSVAKRKDLKNVFVGHEGGDDFVVVCDFEYWEEFAKAFITIFDRGIYQFYNSIDARNGFIESVNRRGERQRFPLMSVSVAVVTNKTRPFTRHAEMIQVAAEVKKVVKGIDGSCYAIDRRKGPVSQADGAIPTAPQAAAMAAAAPQNQPMPQRQPLRPPG